MKICFPSVMYIDHPFIWDYDLETNQAKCTLDLVGATTKYDKSSLLECLRKFDGITINSEDVAIIADVNTFDKDGKRMPLYGMVKTNILAGTTPSFFEEKKISTYSTKPCKGIRIESFLNQERWPNEWGETLSCFSLNEKNKIETLTRSVDLIYTPINLSKNLQYQKNDELYPIKEQQMQIICNLFDNILAPLYDDIDTQDELPTTLSTYLRTMVVQMMTNRRLNYGPTPTEQMSSEERDKKFLENEYEFAIEQEYIARVNVMLRGLLFFISPQMMANSLIKDRQIADKWELLRIKLNTSPNKKVFSENLDLLRALTIEAGKIEYKYNLVMHGLSEKMEGRPACIGNVYSCYNIMLNFIKENLPKEKDSAHSELADETIAEIIKSLRDKYSESTIAKKHIGIPSSAHQDIYLAKSLVEKLSKGLEVQQLHKIPKKELASKLKDTFIRFIETELTEITQQENKSTTKISSDEEEVVTSFGV